MVWCTLKGPPASSVINTMEDIFKLEPQQEEDLILSDLEPEDEAVLIDHIFGVRAKRV